MKVLVTGASGFVGAHLCRHLQHSGIDVRSSTRSQSTQPGEIQLCRVGAIDESTNWQAALTNIDVVVHLAARVHVMKDQESDPARAFMRVNLHGTLNLAQQAARAGVKRFVFVSTVKVNGESSLPGKPFTEEDTPCPQDAYSQSKYEAEHGLLQIASTTPMQVVIIRPPLVYGPGARANFAMLIRAIQQHWPLPLGAINNQRSLLGLDNLVDFIKLCLAHPKVANEIFLISDGHDLSTTELIKAIGSAAQISVHLLPIPVKTLQWVGQVLGKQNAVQRLCGNLQVDISKARNLLGWEPPVSVSQGLRQIMAGNLK